MPDLQKAKTYVINLLIVLFIAAGIFVVTAGRNTNEARIFKYQNKFFNTGWYYYNSSGNKVEIPSLPARIPTDGMESAIYHEISPNDLETNSICFYSQHQDVTLKLNDQVIYTYKTVTKPKTIKSYRAIYNFVTLPAFSEKSVLCIETEAIIDICAGKYEEIFLGDSAQVLFTIIYKHLNTFLLGVMFIVAAFFLFGTYHLFSHTNKKDYTLRDFSLLTFFIGLWQLDDSTLLLFFTGNLPLLWCFKYLNQLLISLFTFLFMRSITVKNDSRFIKVFYWIVIPVIILQFLLQFTGIRAIKSTLYMSYTIYLISSIYILFSLFKEDWIKNSRFKYLCIFAMLTSIVVFALATFSVFNNLFFNSVMSMGVALTFSSLLLITYQKELKLFKEVNNADMYKTLAFIDIATGVYNKTAWFTLIDNFTGKPDSREEYCLIVFDMNYLKKINDTLGHVIGDKMIKSFCNCLVNVVGNMGKIYRVGGDEFICICQNFYRENIMTMLHHFDEAVKNQEETEYKFSAAYGYEFFTPHTTADFKKAIERADEKMYAMKQEMKAARD